MSSSLKIAMEMHMKNPEMFCRLFDFSRPVSYGESGCLKEYMMLKQCMSTNSDHMQSAACLFEYVDYIVCMRKFKE